MRKRKAVKFYAVSVSIIFLSINLVVDKLHIPARIVTGPKIEFIVNLIEFPVACRVTSS